MIRTREEQQQLGKELLLSGDAEGEVFSGQTAVLDLLQTRPEIRASPPELLDAGHSVLYGPPNFKINVST